MHKLFKKLIFSLLIILIAACTSTPRLTMNEALDKYSDVKQFSENMASANGEVLEVLSQTNYGEARKQLNKALELATKNNGDANEVAKQGQRLLSQAQSHAAYAQDVLREVLEARALAIEAGAFTLVKEQMDDLEKDFRDITLDFEEGDSERAKIRRPEMIRRYAQVELAALKQGTVEKAKTYISKADKYRAGNYAPHTFEQANHELNLAASLLDADKGSKAKAEAHAEKAIFLAEQSMVITDVVKEFRENDFTYEDIVLWYQNQLSKATDPLIRDLPLNKANHNLIAYISEQIEQLQNEKNSALSELEKSQDTLKTALSSNAKELSNLRARFEGDVARLEADKQANEQLSALNRQKLEYVQSLFNTSEAIVYRQRDNILIRAHGFYFGIGQSEIDSRNFPLLNKIAQAIQQYPSSTIVVTGHTDSMGNDDLNMRLSNERAQKVAKFLQELQGIPSDRISAEGMGEQSPVANNETEEGRTANRRVEILIVNN